MAIPVKLVLGQYPNESYLDLDALDIAIGIDRKIGYFTLPLNNADRVAIDINTPEMMVTIKGVMKDDEGPVTTDSPSSPALISLYDFYPNTNEGWGRILYDIIKLNSHTTTTSIISNTTFDYGFKVRFSPVVGDKLYTLRGVEIGTISSINYGTRRVVLTGTSAVLTTALTTGNFSVFLHSPDTFLNGKGFVLFPAHWEKNHPNPYPAGLQDGIFFKFDASLTPSYVTGGSHVPVFTGGFPEINSYPTIKIPIKGLYTGTTAGNPSIGLASIIKDAINSSIAVTGTGETNSGGSKLVSGAFTASVTGSTVKISQDEGNILFKPKVGIFNQQSFINNISTIGGVKPWRFDTGGGVLRDGGLPTSVNFSGPSYVGGVKSAGDKVQDLLGFMANSNGGEDDYISGIQIPYSSLIASTGVDPAIRNFFTTYGDISLSKKSSDSNTLPANRRMETSNVTKVTDAATIEDAIIDAVSILAEFAEGMWDSIWGHPVDLAKLPSKGNKGGIHVIPSKLDVHYEATENLYYYDLLLTVIDVVWSP
mgnify:FL=1